MRNRSIPLVIVFTWITFGIYALYWMVSTKNELNARGASIPTALLIIVPIVNIWWIWKYSEGVETATQKEMSAPVAFLMLFVANGMVPAVGSAVLQHSFNKLAGSTPSLPEARVA